MSKYIYGNTALALYLYCDYCDGQLLKGTSGPGGISAVWRPSTRTLYLAFEIEEPICNQMNMKMRTIANYTTVHSAIFALLRTALGGMDSATNYTTVHEKSEKKK